MYVISGRNNTATILFIRKRKVKKGHFTFSIKKCIKKSGNTVDSRHGEQKCKFTNSADLLNLSLSYLVHMHNFSSPIYFEHFSF